jgi:invasion protein IalB
MDILTLEGKRAFALAASMLLATVVTPAMAQQPATKGAPKAAPAQAGAPAAQAQPQDQIQLVYAPWTKVCVKGQEAGAVQVCLTGKDGRIESGQPVVAAVIIEPEGAPKKVLRITLPLGMQLIYGTRIVVDNDPPLQAPFAVCFQSGCMSDYEVTPELLGNLKKGQTLYVQSFNASGAPLTLPLPLAGEFAKAYDGPPADEKMIAEYQKKQQEEIARRKDADRKQLEDAQKAAPQANPAAK